MEPFDYGRPPLMRAVLVRAGNTEHHLVVVMHHLVSDSWSMDIVRHELFSLYSRIAGLRKTVLPPLSIQYADFAHWQRRWLRSEAAERATRYWVDRWSELGSARPTVSDLRFAISDGEPADDEKSRERLSMSAELVSTVRAAARERGVTIYMMAVAALQVVLASYSGKSTVAVMGHFANRVRVETQRVIGWFANAHVLGQPCEPRRSLAQMLESTRRDVLGAYAHQELPLGAVWQRLPQNGGRSRRDQSQWSAEVYVSIDSTSSGAITIGTLRVEPVLVRTPTTMTALGFAIAEHADELALTCTYSSGRFHRSGVRAMLRDIAHVLSAIAGAPETPLAAIAEQLSQSSGAAARS
jgi:hypothetical protein